MGLSKFNGALLAIGMLCGCDVTSQMPGEPLQGLELNAAEKDAKAYLKDGAELIAICGNSSGVGYFLDQPDSMFEPDYLDGGVIVFAKNADGSPDIVHRDALKEMIVVSESGAEISKLPDSEDNRLGIWIVTYPASTIVETYNLTIGKNGDLYALWNANKGKNLMEGRTMSFVSKCEFI